IIGDLAKTWEVNAAGDEYIFHLNDANWADFNGIPGTPVTADDVIYSLDRITQPGALRARTGFLKRWYERGSATAVDDKTVKVPLKFPSAAFIPNLASDYMKIYPRAGTENLGQDDMNCCPGKYYGSGPWIFRDWKKDAEYTWARNTNYFKSPRPFFDGLQVFIVRQTSRRQAAFVAGQAFGTYQPLTNIPRDWTPVEKETNGRMRALILPAGATQVLFLNISKPPFDDPKVRRAIFLGIDRPAVAKTAFGEFTTPGTFFGVNYVETLNEMNNVPGWRTNKQQDFDEARKLLAEAGYPDGLKVTMNTVSTGTTAQGAEALTPQLRKDVGIDITLDAKGLAEMYQGMRDGTGNMSMVGTGPILRDPGDIINQFFDQDVLRNPHNWSDPRIDLLIAAQDKESDPTKRKALIAEMVDVFREGESHIVLFLMVRLGWHAGLPDQELLRSPDHPAGAQVGPPVVRPGPRDAKGTGLSPLGPVRGCQCKNPPNAP
ncbi:MAG: ABC transporter substrate-binding protein, partial [Stenotrophomonas maltophilia]